MGGGPPPRCAPRRADELRARAPGGTSGTPAPTRPAPRSPSTTPCRSSRPSTTAGPVQRVDLRRGAVHDPRTRPAARRRRRHRRRPPRQPAQPRAGPGHRPGRGGVPGGSWPPRGPSRAGRRCSTRSAGTRRCSTPAAGARLRLGRRHSEIVLLLAAHPEGLTGERARPGAVRRRPSAPVTLRAELSRLRRAARARCSSRVRTGCGAACDADYDAVADALSRPGDLRAALAAYAGPLLPLLRGARHRAAAPAARGPAAPAALLAARRPARCWTLAAHPVGRGRPGDVGGAASARASDPLRAALGPPAARTARAYGLEPPAPAPPRTCARDTARNVSQRSRCLTSPALVPAEERGGPPAVQGRPAQ